MSEAMTVAQVIKALQALPDKTIAMMVDCPHCGRGNQLAEIHEFVVLQGPKAGE